MDRPARLLDLAVCAGIAAVLVCSEAALAQDSAERASDVARRAAAAHRASDWKACAEHYARASSLAPTGIQSTASYNAACCYALAGDTDRAFAELKRSIEGGYRDLSHMQRDEELADLHEDPRWKAAVARLEAALQAYRATINVELLELYEQDQGDRHTDPGEGIDWSVVGPRDEARQTRVAEIMAAGGANAADDYYHAAMVYQHGSEPEDVEQAHKWAVQAVELDPDHGDAKWLAAAAEDRYLMYLGKPQKYGTQFRMVDGRWTLWEVDPSITDEERARWNVPPLREAQQRAKAMNRRE